MKGKLPLFENFNSSELSVMTYDSAKVVAIGMLKEYDKTEYTDAERELRIAKMCRVALEKHAERAGFNKIPEFDTAVKQNLRHIKRKYPNGIEDEDYAYALQYAMEDIAEQMGIKKEEEIEEESKADIINQNGKAIKFYLRN